MSPTPQPPAPSRESAVITARASKIRLVLFDIEDGTAVVWAMRLGLQVGLLSARSSAATAQRAAQLGVTLVHQGVASKLETYDLIADSLMLDDAHIAYMGD